MKAEPIVFERIYEAPISKVWKAITDKNDMKQWYFELSEFKPEVGFEFTFVGDDGKQSFLHLCKVLEVVPRKKLKHSWRYDGFEGNSFVTWELFEEGKNRTRVKLTHEGLETFPQTNPSFAKQNFVKGWTSIVGTNLLDFVEVSDIVKSVELNVSAEQLWPILISVEAVTNWAQSFSGGTTVESDFKKGSTIVWKDNTGAVGASGTVYERIENKKLVLVYPEEGQSTTEAYKEDYEITSQNGKSRLTVKAGQLAKMYVKKHEPLWDEVMVKIKEMT